MKNKGVIHCDLKPENILFTDNKCKQINIVDFGSSCFGCETGYTYVQSRYYRSPEVVLGIPYNSQLDMWSVGCIVYELVSGAVLFPAENDESELLEYWYVTVGELPDDLLKKAGKD